ncbi:cyclic nucleotide-binding domain-containing protein [Candidatus Kuenenia sp.]|uniref:cyclic nucleotide-binding domain-containing protein n=1 Tax=Candidatus Kuenenia sp. TaxID=2499824 RepID=UPI0032200886
METTVFKKGEPIAQEGHFTYYVYRILEGEAQLLKNINGREVPILKLGKGAVIGKLSCLEEKRRLASTIAITDVKAEVISKEEFIKTLNELPPEIHASMRELAFLLSDLSSVVGQLIYCRNSMEGKDLSTLSLKSVSGQLDKAPESIKMVYKSLIDDIINNYAKCGETLNEILRKLDGLKEGI